MAERAYADDDEKQELFDKWHEGQIAYYTYVNTGGRSGGSFSELWDNKERTENAFYDYIKKNREPVRKGILSKIKGMFKGK
jgi:hypothetical protein